MIEKTSMGLPSSNHITTRNLYFFSVKIFVVVPAVVSVKYEFPYFEDFPQAVPPVAVVPWASGLVVES